MYQLNPNPLETLKALWLIPSGKVAETRVRILWSRYMIPTFALLQDAVTPPQASIVKQKFVEAIAAFCEELGGSYFEDAANEFETSHLPADQWVRVWLDKFAPCLGLALEAATAIAALEVDHAYQQWASNARAYFDLLPETEKSETKAYYTSICEFVAEAMTRHPFRDVCLKAVTEESKKWQT